MDDYQVLYFYRKSDTLPEDFLMSKHGVQAIEIACQKGWIEKCTTAGSGLIKYRITEQGRAIIETHEISYDFTKPVSQKTHTSYKNNVPSPPKKQSNIPTKPNKPVSTKGKEEKPNVTIAIGFALLGILFLVLGIFLIGNENVFLGVCELPFGILLLYFSVYFIKKEIAQCSKATKRKMVMKICVVIIIAIGAMLASSIYNSPKQQMMRTCNEYGLENIEISLTCYTNYSNYDFYRTKIYCDGFSSLDDELCESFFYHISVIDAEGKIFSDEDTTVYSDGKVYTAKRQDINGENIKVIYVDGKAMDERYDESNKVRCTDCNGRGSYHCSDCNGTGKRLMKSYSEGDWGFTSYTSYDCTDCDGRGRIDCNRCYGEGSYYNIDD